MKLPKPYVAVNRWLGYAFPATIGRLAARLFLTARPPRQPSPLSVAERSVPLPNGGHAWILGKGSRVFLIHGWSSGPDVMFELASRLVSQGFQVVVLRAPGHDPDSPGTSHPGLFVDTLLEAAAVLGRPRVVIGHSMGAGAALVAQAEGIDAERLVLIAGPSNVSGVLDRFVLDAQLPLAAATEFRRQVNAVVGRAEHYFDSERFGSHVNVPVLLVHDLTDAEIPVKEARDLRKRLKYSRLMLTTGLGHRRILQDRSVLAETVAYALQALGEALPSAFDAPISVHIS